MFLDKLLFDEFDLSLIKNKVISRKHVIGMNIYRFLFVPKEKCIYCKKKIPKRDGGVFFPNYGTIHTKCLEPFLIECKHKREVRNLKC